MNTTESIKLQVTVPTGCGVLEELTPPWWVSPRDRELIQLSLQAGGLHPHHLQVNEYLQHLWVSTLIHREHTKRT